MPGKSETTPGPWKVNAKMPQEVCADFTKDYLRQHRCVATAHLNIEDAALIAMAPDLLAENRRLRKALEAALRHDKYHPDGECGCAWTDAARAALSGGRGE